MANQHGTIGREFMGMNSFSGAFVKHSFKMIGTKVGVFVIDNDKCCEL